MSGIGLFGADENLLRGRMIALLQQHVIDVLALRREPEPARVQAFGQLPIQFVVAGGHHGNCKR